MMTVEINTALKSFIETFGTVPGAIPPCRVLAGYQNRITKPKELDFVIFTPISQLQLAFGGYCWDGNYAAANAVVGTWTVRNLYQYTYQVDCFGPSGHDRLNRLSLIWRDGIGQRFMAWVCRDYSEYIGVISASPIRNNTVVEGTDDYNPRFSADFTFSTRLRASFSVPWFTDTDLDLRGI